MLTCVCRPVSSSFIDKQSIMGAPLDRDQIVVTSEPKTKVGTAKPIISQNPQVFSSCMLVLLFTFDFPQTLVEDSRLDISTFSITPPCVNL